MLASVRRGDVSDMTQEKNVKKTGNKISIFNLLKLTLTSRRISAPNKTAVQNISVLDISATGFHGHCS